ncbi:MAG: CARDB domain-containing protein [Myxococcota bacterium]
MNAISRPSPWILGAGLGVVLAAAVSVESVDAAPIPGLDPCLINPNGCLDPCELNPQLCPDFPVDPPAAEADLRIMDLYVDYRQGECVIVATVENLGDAAAGSFDLDVFIDNGTPPEIGELSPFYLTHPGVGAGATADLEMPIPGGYGGSVRNISALVDSTRTVEESNEGNNLWFRCTSQWLGCLI